MPTENAVLYYKNTAKKALKELRVIITQIIELNIKFIIILRNIKANARKLTLINPLSQKLIFFKVQNREINVMCIIS